MDIPNNSVPRFASVRRPKFCSRHFSYTDLPASGHCSLYSRFIGSVRIDCTFRCNKSKWGVLREQEHPAGIIYVDLNLGRPKGPRILDAEFTFTLDDKHECLSQFAERKLHQKNFPVRFTEFFGPQSLVGPERVTNVTANRRLVLEMGLNVGPGGGTLKTPEKNKSETFQQWETWTVDGSLGSNKTGLYDQLVWNINENERDVQMSHSNTVKTAFTFEHAGQPFVIKVHATGRLFKWIHQAKAKIGSFCGRNKMHNLTLVDFEDYENFRTSLDEFAKNLDAEMAEENPKDTSGKSCSMSATPEQSADPSAEATPWVSPPQAARIEGIAQEALEIPVVGDESRGGSLLYEYLAQWVAGLGTTLLKRIPLPPMLIVLPSFILLILGMAWQHFHYFQHFFGKVN